MLAKLQAILPPDQLAYVTQLAQLVTYTVAAVGVVYVLARNPADIERAAGIPERKGRR